MDWVVIATLIVSLILLAEAVLFAPDKLRKRRNKHDKPE